MALDPKVREKLLKESRSPYKGIRRVIWIALFASALIGLLIMSVRFVSGENVMMNDFGVQAIAVLLFSVLMIVDRSKED